MSDSRPLSRSIVFDESVFATWNVLEYLQELRSDTFLYDEMQSCAGCEAALTHWGHKSKEATLGTQPGLCDGWSSELSPLFRGCRSRESRRRRNVLRVEAHYRTL